MTHEPLKLFISDEMRAAALGSFPLSPGIRSGHTAVALLYWSYRGVLLRDRTVEEIFDTTTPEPPKLVIPEGHIPLTAIQGLNQSVWEEFLRISFKDRPPVDDSQQLRHLISENARVDKNKFENRLKGQTSKVVNGQVRPSLLRAFTIENTFPIQNAFFEWLLSRLLLEMTVAHEQQFKQPWTSSLKSIVELWNKTFPNNPFFPTST